MEKKSDDMELDEPPDFPYSVEESFIESNFINSLRLYNGTYEVATESEDEGYESEYQEDGEEDIGDFNFEFDEIYNTDLSLRSGVEEFEATDMDFNGLNLESPYPDIEFNILEEEILDDGFRSFVLGYMARQKVSLTSIIFANVGLKMYCRLSFDETLSILSLLNTCRYFICDYDMFYDVIYQIQEDLDEDDEFHQDICNAILSNQSLANYVMNQNKF